MRDSELFDRAVTGFFGSVASKARATLTKVAEGVYEISGPHFILRIRLSTGHRRGLDVLLRPATMQVFDESQPGIEYGLGNFALVEGDAWEAHDIYSDNDFVDEAGRLAKASEYYLLPYLTGEKKSLDAVKEMVRKRTEENLAKIKGYRFPKNTREEWL